MEEQLIFIEGYTNRLVERGKCLQTIGLWNGKMGVAIYLLHFTRITKNRIYENEAYELIDAVYKQIPFEKSVCFDNGLLGIGCGLQYLINNRFVEADSDEVLLELDDIAKNIIDIRSLDIINLEKGICGVGYYLYQRLKNRVNENDNMTVLKLKEYLIYLIDWIEDLVLQTSDKQDYNDVYFLLCRLNKLNIFDYKVKRLLALSSRKIIDFNCRITDNYELLGIPSLKVLKPWM